jgi:hypothetical protein
MIKLVLILNYKINGVSIQQEILYYSLIIIYCNILVITCKLLSIHKYNNFIHNHNAIYTLITNFFKHSKLK